MEKKSKLFCHEYLKHIIQEAKSRGYNFYTYFLINPITREVFYVGKGSGVRVFQHIRDKNNPIKTKIIVENNYKIILSIFSFHKEEKDAFRVEKKLIRENEKLTNILSGGRTKEEKNIALAKTMLLKIMPFEFWVIKMKPSVGDVILYWRIVFELQDLAKGGQRVFVKK